MTRIHIVAGIILNAQQDQVFITKRPSDKHKGGFWEFPGGKVEEGESRESAMARELDEEVGIQVRKQTLLEHLEYDYPDKSLKFDFMLITKFNELPYGKEGQESQWVNINELAKFEFPEANLPIVERVMKEFS